MTLYLNGTTGISGVDGSAGTPAVQGTDTNTGISFPAADTIAFNEGGAEVGRFDSSGRLLVGTSSAESYYSAYTPVNLFTPAVQVKGAYPNANLALNTTNDGSVIHLVNSSTSTSSGRLLGAISFNASDGTNNLVGAGILAYTDATTGANDMPGRLVFSTTADGASSPTERMRIGSSGSVLVGTTTSAYNAKGVEQGSEGYLFVTRDGAIPMWVNRLTNDGVLIEFAQATTVEGNISVSGTTVSYNGAHLSRWSQIPGIDPHDKTVRPEILRGTVMSNLDEMCNWIDPESGEAQDNEQLNKTKISDAEGDKNVAGIFQCWDDDDDTWVNDYYLAMTGDFIIRIAEGVTVERGDLLMSAGDGTAKPQDDDIIRSKTIAKVTSTNVSCTYEDGSYCVPCVLMAC